MAIDLQQHFQQVSHSQIPLWIDGWAYGLHLLNEGNQPDWCDTAVTINYLKTLQELIKSDVIPLPVGDFYTHWLTTHPALRTAMGEKRRLGYALRTMLADTEAKNQLSNILYGLCESHPSTPIVFVIPSPKRWMATAHEIAKAINDVSVSWDEAESAAMYVADFLRHFSNSRLSAVLLKDNADSAPANDAELSRYQPILNVANNYQWKIIIEGHGSNYHPKPALGVAYSIHPDYAIKTNIDAQENNTSGLLLNFESFHDFDSFHGFDSLHSLQNLPSLRDAATRLTSAHPNDTLHYAFCYTSIPPDATPETVLETLLAIRNSSLSLQREVNDS